jgi:hypothetical protein
MGPKAAPNPAPPPPATAPSTSNAPAPTPASTAAATAAPSAGVPTVPADRGTEFKPVTGAPEMQSVEMLLVEAYAAIWLVLFAMVLLAWRRQRGVEERIATLEGAIRKAREDKGAT